MEMISNANIAQVFLWMQDKSVFGMGAVIGTETPSIKFGAIDLLG